jgi:pSer/pThr/pTyr-binding forkhead associated (FHA) protein
MSARQRSPQNNAGTAQPLEAYYEDARSLGAAEFVARHGDGFLITATRLQPPSSDSFTEVKLEEDRADHTAGISTLVYSVRPTERATVHLLTVGRTPNNDVVVRDTSVSRFHAYVKPGESGGLLIQDAGSTNGTLVNGESVPSRGNGPAAELKPGDDVRLGQVDFTFVDAAGLRSFARRAGG